MANSHPKESAQKKRPLEITEKRAQKSSGGKKSHIDFALQIRHIDTAGRRTTIALERAFWRQADSQAEQVGLSWQGWAVGMLEERPGNIGRARWLRVKLLTTDREQQ